MKSHLTVACAGLCLSVVSVAANDMGSPPMEAIESLYPGKTYSPYAKRSFPSHVFWGDTHLHTALSLDAGLFGNTLGAASYPPLRSLRQRWQSGEPHANAPTAR